MSSASDLPKWRMINNHKFEKYMVLQASTPFHVSVEFPDPTERLRGTKLYAVRPDFDWHDEFQPHCFNWDKAKMAPFLFPEEKLYDYPGDKALETDMRKDLEYVELKCHAFHMHHKLKEPFKLLWVFELYYGGGREKCWAVCSDIIYPTDAHAAEAKRKAGVSK